MEQPVVVCGLGNVGRRVLDYLLAAGVPVIAVDNRCKPEDLRREGVRLIQGDCRRQEVLAQAGLEHARGVLILTSDDLINISTTLMVRHLQPDVRVVVRLFNQGLLTRLGKAVTNTFALSVSQLTAPLLALTALTGQALGTFSLRDGRRQIATLTVPEGSWLCQKTIATAATRHRALVLAHGPAQGEERFLLDVDAEARLAPGDELVVCGEPRAIAPLLEGGGEETPPHLLWAGWLRRNGRVVWRTLAEVDLSVKICTAVLLGVVAASTLVVQLGGIRPNLAQAFYRTISVMATGADMQGENLVGWQQVFVGALRLMGTALVASFTAIFTNYLLRARLSGALEVRRIPDSGHIVLCGLNNLGFRLLEELLSYDERVVVIESKRDNRFMAAARRKRHVAVIVGDPSVQEVLRQAHAATARAVVAAGTDELANLEIALLACELNPKQRVIVRLADSRLSETLREAANIRLALDIPSLAAPAFLAALYGDRVLSVFLVKGRLLTVVELIVQADDACLHGQVVRALAIDYRLLPVSLTDAEQSVRPQPMDHRLSAGDRLTVITALPDLERLLRRERAPADCLVEVTGCTLPARPLLLQLLRERRVLDIASADAAAERLPVCLGEKLTRGQAEDLLVNLRREGVKARVHDAHASVT
jgi:Trk K+ transport system NAD-binding subunit